MTSFFSLERQYKEIKQEIDTCLKQVVRTGYFTLGSEVTKFEREFADYIGRDFAVGVASGTDALTLGLKALGLDPDEEVVVPANVYPTAFGVALSGVRLRLIDCDETGNFDPMLLPQVVSPKTKAIIAVHLYGNPCSLPQIEHFLAKRKQIFLVEDAAQAHGAMLKSSKQWRKAGSFGKIACFSFYPTKNLGAYGDAGMVLTDDPKITQRLRRLRNYGEKERYQSLEISGVSRLDEIQAAILRVKLKYLDKWNKRRQEIAKYYLRELKEVGDLKLLGIQTEDKRHCYHLFVIRTKQRDELQEYLLKNEIETKVHYPLPVHLTRAFRYLGYRKGDFPLSEAMSREVLSLPFFPELTDNEIEEVAAKIKTFAFKLR